MRRPSNLPIAVLAAATLGCGFLEPPLDVDNTVMVIVAARDLYPGVTIEEGDLYALEIPVGLLPEGVFLSPEHVVGRVPKERLLANEFVHARRLSDPESGLGLQSIVPVGTRVIALPGHDVPLAPGDYVDVWTTEGTPCAVARAVFVLGVNDAIARGERAPAETFTVLTSPQHMGRLLADAGAMRITVRNPNDVFDTDLGALCSP